MVARKAYLLILLAFFMAGLTACPPPNPCVENPALAECQPRTPVTPDWMITGKQFLSNFEGKRANDNFLIGLRTYEEGLRKDKFYCEAHHGLILANAQMFLGELNFLFKLLLKGTLASPDIGGAQFAPGTPAYMASMLRIAEANKYDFNNNLEGKWASSLEPRLLKIAEYAEAVTQITEVSDCSFSIGVEPAEVEKFEYVLNLGDNLLPILQIAFKGRLDGAEARLFGMIARSMLGTGDFWLAHSLEMSIDVVKIGYMLGLDPECLQKDALSCFTSGDLFGNPVNYLDAAFIFQDNPNLLGKSATRWDRRFSTVDNHFAAGFNALRTFFGSLSSRALYWKEQPSLDRQLDEYFIRYQDRNDSGKVDEGDSLGVNITAVRCSAEFLIKTGDLTDAQAQDLNDTCATIQGLADTALITMRNPINPSSEVVGEIDAFSQRMFDNMTRVDNPGHAYERIPINSFDTILVTFIIPILSAFTPNWLELDLASYMINAEPLREFVPLWQFPFHTFTHSRFVLDSDLYDNGFSTHTLAEIYFEPSVTNNTFTLVEERPTLSEPIAHGGTYETPLYITGMVQPADCINMTNLTGVLGQTTFGWPVVTAAWPDPSFGGLLYVNLEPWQNLNPDYLAFAPADCSNETTGFVSATNYSLTKGMWQYVAFLWDNFEFASLLNEDTFNF